MIEINLVPVNLRKQQGRGIGVFGSIALPEGILFGVGGIFVVILILIHGLLVSLWVVKGVRYAFYKTVWTKMLPDKNSIDSLSRQIKDLNSRTSTITGIASHKNILWSQKLNILSDTIPKGMWLKKIDWNNNILTIEGCAVSRFHDEITIVGNFVSNLQRTQDFIKDFSSLELNSVNRSKKGVTEVADFMMTAKAK